MKVGIDITKNQRFSQIIVEYKKYSKILSEKEIAIFKKITLEKRKLEYIASRFDTKEALYKAINNNIPYNKISVLNNETGKPYIECEELKNENINVSLSHEDEYSIAIIIIE